MNDVQLVALALLQKRKKIARPFPKQQAFVDDPNMFVGACCTRRAGKSNGLGLKFYNQMIKHPSTLSRYIALTRDSAKDIMWPALHELNDTHKWGATFVENPLMMVLPNGSRLRLIGADMKNFIARLRGAKTVANAIDEAQSFGPHIESLVNDVLVPTMADYTDSWLAVTGTPGVIPKGFFYDLSMRGVGGFSMHHWSLTDNPHLPNSKQFIADLKARQKWDDNHPTYLREWLGKWVTDTSAMLIKYSESVNHYAVLPNYQWTYILGVDIGLRDADALAVLAWSPQTSNIYLVEEHINADQDLTKLANQIDSITAKYDISKIVMDEGGLGAKIAEEFRRRKGIPVQAAKKARKMENVALLNDWLRQGRFFAKSDSKFAEDSYLVQIDYERSTPDRIVVKSDYHSDIIDAVLYAFKESPAFTFEPSVIAPKWGSKEWQEAEIVRMERDAEEYFQKQQDILAII
jgi:hypothetical protein